MLQHSNYYSPVCVQFEVCTEGVLCGSVDEFDTTKNTETFSMNEFEW